MTENENLEGKCIICDSNTSLRSCTMYILDFKTNEGKFLCSDGCYFQYLKKEAYKNGSN